MYKSVTQLHDCPFTNFDKIMSSSKQHTKYLEGPNKVQHVEMTVNKPTMKSKHSICVEKYCIQLTARNEVISEKLTGPQVTKNFLVFYRTRSFITALTKAHHLILFTATSFQSMP